MIADSECVIIHSTINQIICETGNFLHSSMKALVKVSVDNFGEAINVNIFFK